MFVASCPVCYRHPLQPADVLPTKALRSTFRLLRQPVCLDLSGVGGRILEELIALAVDANFRSGWIRFVSSDVYLIY